MSYRLGDINDNQIRIISSGAPDPGKRPERDSEKKKRRKYLVPLFCGIAALLLTVAIAIPVFAPEKAADEESGAMEEQPQSALSGETANTAGVANAAYAICKDTIVNGIELEILTPVNAMPVLEMGNSVLRDSTAVLIAQAADIREDNQEIAGSFVVKGELMGKGEAKAGFCSIINGEVTVGVADATPMFEEALTSDGYFFRQYPLVVAGQIVENKPKGASIRRALADMGGRYCVIVSRDKVTFHDFSQALADAGVRNAIYLVGGMAYGRYKDASGRTISIGQPWDNRVKNINYIVWR